MKTIEVLINYSGLVCGYARVETIILDKLIAAGIPMYRNWPPAPHRGRLDSYQCPMTGDVVYTWRGEETHPFDHE